MALSKDFGTVKSIPFFYLAKPFAKELYVRKIKIISAFFDKESFISSLAFSLFSVPSISWINVSSTSAPSLKSSKNALTSVLYEQIFRSQAQNQPLEQD